MNDSRQLYMTVYAALFAALITAGSYLIIPIGPVPIVLQNMFVMLAGLLLGWKWGAASVGVYLLAGILGLPVFAGATGGIARFYGPTGGYLVSYVFAALVIGLISGMAEGKSDKTRVVWDFIAMLVGGAIVYGIGVPWLKLVTGMAWGKALSVGMIPFIPGDLLKIIAAVPIAKTLRPFILGRVTPMHANAETHS